MKSLTIKCQNLKIHFAPKQDLGIYSFPKLEVRTGFLRHKLRRSAKPVVTELNVSSSQSTKTFTMGSGAVYQVMTGSSSFRALVVVKPAPTGAKELTNIGNKDFLMNGLPVA